MTEDLKKEKLQTPTSVLNEYWGFPSFRGQQLKAIEAVLNKKDVLFLAPTGLGKSCVFQIPAIMMEGTCIVVSPLLALMDDQIRSLENKGVPSLTINSTLGVRDRRTAIETLKEGNLKLIYMAPETLLNEEIVALINEFVTISFIAFDEAHIISSWGNGFRPTYTQVGKVRTLFPKCPIIALTATADANTKIDIVNTLTLQHAETFIHDFDRPNIQYNVYIKRDELSQTLRLINKYPKGTAGIVYCMSRQKTEDLAASLKKNGINAEAFHAGLNVKSKTRVITLNGEEKELVTKGKTQIQQEYMDGTIDVIVATIAFGMGIDKSNVRFVIHVDIPTSLEGFSQETGRNGRDGDPSEAYLLYDAKDVNKARWLLQQSIKNPDRLKINFLKLKAMTDLCLTSACRRIILLKYFGQKSKACNNCDNCFINNAVKATGVP